MKFNRKYRLTIDLNDGSGAIIVEPPFTIEFNIQRAAMASVNSMSLAIYNLSEKTRSRIFQDRYQIGSYKRITLEAGYGESLTQVYSGSIFQAHSELAGPDIKTNIVSRDGYFDAVSTQSNRSFAAGTTLRGLLSDLTGDFPNLKKGSIGGDDITFDRPVTVEGNTYETIKKYSRNQVFIDNERVNVLNPNQVIDRPVFLMNADTGLLETPKREDTFLTITTLFEPRITIGQIIELDSLITPIYNGQYKVIGASHGGVISEAVSGTLKSTFNLFLGSQLFGRFQPVDAG